MGSFVSNLTEVPIVVGETKQFKCVIIVTYFLFPEINICIIVLGFGIFNFQFSITLENEKEEDISELHRRLSGVVSFFLVAPRFLSGKMSTHYDLLIFFKWLRNQKHKNDWQCCKSLSGKK